MGSLLIKNAIILDGTGEEPFLGDIRVVENKIGQIGVDLPVGESRLLDVTGLYACPGFIDMHSHADLALLKKPVPDQKIRQGVTTELLGQDGLGVAPLDEGSIDDLKEIISGLQGKLVDTAWTWESFSDYLDILDRVGVPNHVAVLATHAPLRLMSAGMEERTTSPKERTYMKQMLVDCMRSGAFGFSSGLEYPPQYNADTQELIDLNKIVAEYNGVYIVHQRNEGRKLIQSFEEQLRIARASGVRLHISHLKAWGPANWSKIDSVLQTAQAYHEAGGIISWDRYPYLSGSTLLGIILPHWAWADGTEALLQHLQTKDFRESLRADYSLTSDEWENDPGSIGWGNILVSGVTLKENLWMEGKSIVELADANDKDEVDFLCDLLGMEHLAVTAIFNYGNEKVLEKVLSHPLSCVGSDGILLGQPHPRLFDSFPRFIREFALKKNILSLPEAIRKVTGFPASILGLDRRGQLREGWFADVVLFDAINLVSPENTNDPKKYPKGIVHVLLDGCQVVRDAVFTGELAGQVLRKH
jgi:N-acyl-D-amino-acid deacylase